MPEDDKDFLSLDEIKLVISGVEPVALSTREKIAKLRSSLEGKTQMLGDGTLSQSAGPLWESVSKELHGQADKLSEAALRFVLGGKQPAVADGAAVAKQIHASFPHKGDPNSWDACKLFMFAAEP